MTKNDIYKRAAVETGLMQVQTKDIVQKFFDYIADALADGDKLEFRDFGVFELRLAQARKGRNPQKPENEVIIPKHYVVKFRAGGKLKQHVRLIDPKIVNKF